MACHAAGPGKNPADDAGSGNIMRGEFADLSPHHGMTIGEYLATRISSLRPAMVVPPNPLRLLGMLKPRHWASFLVAFAAWTWDAFDFFTVSLTVQDLAKQFGKTTTEITWGITLVLMFRSVGSVVFGVAADRYGRKWPFVVNNVLFIGLELGTGFCNTYDQFLACRALFGVAMGGLYGNAVATALEDLPVETRGLMSGLFQQGYAFGYLLATAFARGLVDTTRHSWRPLYWFGAFPPVLIILMRLVLPETTVNEHRERVRRHATASSAVSPTTAFLQEARGGLRHHWLLLVYLVLLMAGFNFMSHGSQDLYPTMLRNQYEFGKDDVTVTQVVANLGAISGGAVVGYYSQILGRRLSIMVMCLLGAALLYPYTFTSTTAVAAAAFAEQFCVQGAWGVVPIYLMELSPTAIRTFVVGTSYQLGNLISSASSTIESSLGERYPLPRSTGNEGASRYRYGLVICIFMACVYAYVSLLVLVGPEHLKRRFEMAPESDFSAAVGPVGSVATEEKGATDLVNVVATHDSRMGDGRKIVPGVPLRRGNDPQPDADEVQAWK